MKEYLSTLISSAPTPDHARNVVQEYLQARILGSLQHSGAMIPLAFHGGTALRFLYSTTRYSEDLDFTLERSHGSYDFRAYLNTIQNEFSKEAYSVELKISDKKVVHSAFVRFRGLLYDLSLSPRRDETLSVKIEVDTKPPAGANLRTTIVRRHILLHIQHHDPASMLAGKLHAILQRSYSKGRDIYDLLWYLSDPEWPAPNLVLLSNALQQTGWEGEELTESNWRAIVRDRVLVLNWTQVLNDVRPFLDNQRDIELLTQDNLLRMLH